MNLTNETGMAAGYTTNLGKDGRESLVVVVKGTFLFPRHPDDEPALAPDQVPLWMADEFAGEPGESAPLAELDFAPHKPRCDVLLTGTAHAPGGRPAERVPVAVRVGRMQKAFDVVGNRVWQAGTLTMGVSRPEPFTRMPIAYDRAFGGIDRARGDPATFRWYLTNHVGVGWHEYLDTRYLDQTPLPNMEEAGNPVRKPNGTYRPMAFGPVGRAWQPRVRWAGTYDKAWLDTKRPFLPDDFDDRYYQAAAEDQQTEYIRGGEEVILTNLTPAGHAAFRMPKDVRLSVLVALKNGAETELPAAVDTVVFEPDRGRFMLVWRARLPLRRSLFEVRGAVAGRTAEQSRRMKSRTTRQRGKPRFASLAELPIWPREGPDETPE